MFWFSSSAAVLSRFLANFFFMLPTNDSYLWTRCVSWNRSKMCSPEQLFKPQRHLLVRHVLLHLAAVVLLLLLQRFPPRVHLHHQLLDTELSDQSEQEGLVRDLLAMSRELTSTSGLNPLKDIRP